MGGTLSVLLEADRGRLRSLGSIGNARLDQIINLKHELMQLGARIDWDWIDREIAPLCSEKGRPGIESRFVIGLLLLKHIYGLSDEGVGEHWVHDPYFQHFTGFEFFQDEFPHERSDLSHWRQRFGDKLELLLAESLRAAHQTGAQRTRDLKRVNGGHYRSAQGHHLPDRRQARPCGDQRAQSRGPRARRAAAAVVSAPSVAEKANGPLHVNLA